MISCHEESIIHVFKHLAYTILSTSAHGDTVCSRMISEVPGKNVCGYCGLFDNYVVFPGSTRGLGQAEYHSRVHSCSRDLGFFRGPDKKK